MAMENRVSETSSREKRQSFRPVERSEALVPKRASFYGVMGHRPEEPGALALMAEILAKIATDEQVDHALTCACKCRYPVRLPDILRWIPGQEIAQSDAEARKAWDVLVQFAEKWVQSDVEGRYMITRGVRSTEPPMLNQRIADTVRRTGGWRAYKTMNQNDYPHQQKRFFEEYEAWTAVEQVLPMKLLTEMPKLQLLAKPMERQKAEVLPASSVDAAVVKRVPEPLSEAQVRDRRG
jgi:hypothetical protein